MSNRTVIVSRPKGTGPLETVPPISINGTNYPYSYDKPVTLPGHVIGVLRDSGLTVSDFNSPASDSLPAGDGDAAAGNGEPGGKQPGGSDTDPDFDAQAIIKGTVDEVEQRIENLTLAQLDAVAEAENALPKPRVGVKDAIERARQAFTAPSNQ